MGYIYNPKTDSFTKGAPMPAGRARGAGGIAAYSGKIYYAGGMHDGKTVTWFDVYDPRTNTWSQLPNMPRVRDHFQAAVVNGKFYAIGGRDSGVSLNATTPKVDVYDLTKGAAGAWQTPNTGLPTQRGGFATAVLGKEILVIGGEGGGKAYNTVEAYNNSTNKWRNLEPMPTSRHGTQAVVCNGGVYVAAGGTKQGGGGETNKHEVFFLGTPAACGVPQDTTPPDTRITSGPSGTAGTNAAAFGFSASEANSTFECRLDGGSFNPCASPKRYGNLPDGPHTFQVRARDAAGNPDPTPASRSWTVNTATASPSKDTLRPTITRPRPVPGSAIRNRTPTVSVLVRDRETNLARRHITLALDGKKRGAFTYNRKNDRLAYTTPRLKLGWHSVRVVAVDAVGNRTVKTWSFKVVKKRR